jgi:hypothetical protein
MKKFIIGLFVLVGIAAAVTLNYQSDLVFSHRFHIEDAEVECVACHGDVMKSLSSADDLLPEMETCYECHDEAETECTFCHEKGDDPVLLPRIDKYIAKFSHKKHLEKNDDCTVCHANITQKERVNVSLHLPTMQDCYTCHEMPETTEGCYTCHNENENLEPGDHGIAWEEMHGIAAMGAESSCNSCHTDNYCITCHSGANINESSHKPGFILTHSIAHSTKETDCATCHQDVDYCITCHTTTNYIIPADHKMESWKDEHFIEARIEPERCMVCHYQGDDKCSKCHN